MFREGLNGFKRNDTPLKIPKWEPTPEQEALFKEWKEFVIQDLVSRKAGVEPRKLPNYLEEATGERIPISRMGLGFGNMNHFLYRMGNDLEVFEVDGRLYVAIKECSVPEAMYDIRQMVLEQRKDRHDYPLRKHGWHYPPEKLLMYAAPQRQFQFNGNSVGMTRMFPSGPSNPQRSYRGGRGGRGNHRSSRYGNDSKTGPSMSILRSRNYDRKVKVDPDLVERCAKYGEHLARRIPNVDLANDDDWGTTTSSQSPSNVAATTTETNFRPKSVDRRPSKRIFIPGLADSDEEEDDDGFDVYYGGSSSAFNDGWSDEETGAPSPPVVTVTTTSKVHPEKTSSDNWKAKPSSNIDSLSAKLALPQSSTQINGLTSSIQSHSSSSGFIESEALPSSLRRVSQCLSEQTDSSQTENALKPISSSKLFSIAINGITKERSGSRNKLESSPSNHPYSLENGPTFTKKVCKDEINTESKSACFSGVSHQNLGLLEETKASTDCLDNETVTRERKEDIAATLRSNSARSSSDVQQNSSLTNVETASKPLTAINSDGRTPAESGMEDFRTNFKEMKLGEKLDSVIHYGYNLDTCTGLDYSIKGSVNFEGKIGTHLFADVKQFKFPRYLISDESPSLKAFLEKMGQLDEFLNAV